MTFPLTGDEEAGGEGDITEIAEKLEGQKLDDQKTDAAAEQGEEGGQDNGIS